MKIIQLASAELLLLHITVVCDWINIRILLKIYISWFIHVYMYLFKYNCCCTVGQNARKRRSLFDRFSQVGPLDDEITLFCFKLTGKVNNRELTFRGCGSTPGKPEDECKKASEIAEGITSCKVCTTDKCNSATSNIVFTSMIISLVAVILFTK
ncbi:uncharacterized protein LOC143182039 [Calliopsis andreniformis]|uniref:uncharacterized protein LOC143182039 n=1 Tax=Calliopsis andreniformis TaxID=337506 RepID=UPI003FCCF9B0